MSGCFYFFLYIYLSVSVRRIVVGENEFKVAELVIRVCVRFFFHTRTATFKDFIYYFTFCFSTNRNYKMAEEVLLYELHISATIEIMPWVRFGVPVCKCVRCDDAIMAWVRSVVCDCWSSVCRTL